MCSRGQIWDREFGTAGSGCGGLHGASCYVGGKNENLRVSVIQYGKGWGRE